MPPRRRKTKSKRPNLKNLTQKNSENTTKKVPADEEENSKNLRTSKRLKSSTTEEDIEAPQQITEVKTPEPKPPTTTYTTPKSARLSGFFKASKPGTSSTSSTSGKVYEKAKSFFRLSATPKKLVGRKTERDTITEFLEKHIIEKKPGSLFIHGIPGTGKTALVNEIYNDMKDSIEKRAKCSVKFVNINCMSLNDPKKIYATILDILDQKVATNGVKNPEEVLNYLFLKSKKNAMYIVILDEIDSLITNDREILYKLFDWTLVYTSRLILIGISNMSKLTESLPRLKDKDCQPQVLNFAPYDNSEIADIIKDRLKAASSSQEHSFLVDDKAIELCAKRVAANNGDCRKALDVLRKSFELAETEDIDNILNSDTKDSTEKSELDNSNSPMVTITHINQVTNSDITGTSMMRTLNTLPFLQLLIICTLVIMKKKKMKKITYGELFPEYQRFCRNRNHLPVNSSEFEMPVQRLESAGLIKITRSRSGSADRVIQLSPDVERDIWNVVDNNDILKSMMNDALRSL
ncbi:8241_t:CDS:2 [Cetraspora pellucida]|uniref:Cell division control protein n=1 Tax=Cetraspora pellucida TaxID=1433469 RepID=A0A9N9DQM0_9GLOM|nr:8241_t:CDS:2 [Cetraspora pellucida]